MSTPKHEPSQQTALTRVMDWWQDARHHWARLHELDQIDPNELSRIAADVGISTDSLVRLARQPDGASLLIEKRMAALELDPEDVRKLSPLILRDLQRTCALCSDKGRCADDMALDPLAPGWESYCPNSSTLRGLT